ncbi:MAG: hypothetical protein HZY79_05285 [Rhodoblastus sp.]|nr:MAG: hypothetical protein HZY79_05285 [Rhodoblastus sp.]
MIYVLSQYWVFAGLAALLGLAVGWLTCAPPRDGRLGWLTWGLLAFVVGLVTALAGAAPGLAGHAIEIALLLFAAYLLGCWLGCLLKRGRDAGAASETGKSGKATPAPARGDGKTAALAGPGTAQAVGAVAAAGAGASAARAARDAAKAKARAEADAKSHAKFVEEEAARARRKPSASPARRPRRRPRRAARLSFSRVRRSARAGKSSAPARDFSVAKGDPLTWIASVGPHAERKLNELGVRKFAQIAGWTPSNGRWIDERLGEPGRVAREDWVAQARRLARGEMTDHALAVKSGAIRIDDAPPPNKAKTRPRPKPRRRRPDLKARPAKHDLASLDAASRDARAPAAHGSADKSEKEAAAGEAPERGNGAPHAGENGAEGNTAEGAGPRPPLAEKFDRPRLWRRPRSRLRPPIRRRRWFRASDDASRDVGAVQAAPLASDHLAVETSGTSTRRHDGESQDAEAQDAQEAQDGLGRQDGLRQDGPRNAQNEDARNEVARDEDEARDAQASGGERGDAASATVSYPAPRPRADAGHGGLTSAPAAPAASRHVQEPLDGAHDDLKWIRGVGPVNERVLHGLGVRRFAQIAAWSPETTERVGRHLSVAGRIERERWIEQARLLAAGVMTDHAAAAKSGALDLSRADDALDADEAERFAASLPRPAAPVEDEDRHDGARPLGLAGPRGARADDLKLIRGIGRQNERRLHALGVWHFDQIAAWSVENVKWVGSYLAFPGRIDREQWIAQAARLARGETTEFAERVKKGDVPTSSNE